MEDKLKEKIDKFLAAYLDCANKAAEDFLAGRPLNLQEMSALGDSIRVLHHIYQMTTE